MCRIDADDAHAGRRQATSRHGEVECERAGSADDRAVLPCRVHALGGDLVEELPHALLGRRHAEVLADREDSACELVEIFDRANVERHQKSSGQYGGRGVRKSSSARASAPVFSSRTRSAAASRLNVNAPRYTEARSATSSSRSASSWTRSTPPPTRQRPAFQGQNSSRTSSTTSPSPAYVRPPSAAPTSTSRTQRPSYRRRWRLRASTTIRGNADAGSTRLSTRTIRSMPKRKRHSSRSAAGVAASASTTRTLLFEKPFSHADFTR